MKSLLFLFLLLHLARLVFGTGSWAVDRACDDGGISDGIKLSMKGALARAAAAYDKMNSHLENHDALVDRAVKIIIGSAFNEEDYKSTFLRIMENFKTISEINEKAFIPDRDNVRWWVTGGKSWDSVEFWCSIPDDRFKRLPISEDGKQKWTDISMYPHSPVQLEDIQIDHKRKCHAGEKIDFGKGPVDVEAVTIRYEGRKDGNKPRDDPTNLISGGKAATIDLCKGPRDMWSSKGWPILTADFVEKTRLPDGLRKANDEWRAAEPDSAFVPLEELHTMEHLVLHELFHTKHGGRKLDKGKGNIDCYGFSCVTNIQEAQNADSLAYLGLMLQLIGWGYMVNSDGAVFKSGI